MPLLAHEENPSIDERFRQIVYSEPDLLARQFNDIIASGWAAPRGHGPTPGAAAAEPVVGGRRSGESSSTAEGAASSIHAGVRSPPIVR
jgi:hypothetical protein